MAKTYPPAELDSEEETVVEASPTPAPPDLDGLSASPAAAPVSKKERPVTSFAKTDRDDVLGPNARLAPNYSLYQKNGAADDGRLMKMKVGIDDPQVGAVIVWRDTLGLRHVRVPANRAMPFTFDVAIGQIDQLLDAYIVYGRFWSTNQDSPWGGEGWFKETIGYFGPEDHGAFINGKKSFRKNLWLPASTVNPSKSLTPAAFLRGAKRL